MSLETSQLTLIILALAIWIAGYFHTGKYVRPKWKIAGKLIFYMLISTLLIYYFDYYALIFIIGHQLIGLIFHIRVCKRHNINWVNCEPKNQYLALQEKWARGEFD